MPVANSGQLLFLKKKARSWPGESSPGMFRNLLIKTRELIIPKVLVRCLNENDSVSVNRVSM